MPTAAQIAGIVRAALAAASGAVISTGAVDAAAWDEVTGAVVLLATIAWSVYAKKQAAE